MADAELGVMLEPTNDLEEDVDDISVGVTGDGGGTPAQREQQEGIIAGGVSRGLLAAGVLGGILSQLKSVQGIIEGVLGFLSRALLPAVEVITEVIRPLISGINDFLSNPTQALQEAQRTAGFGQTAREEGATGPFTGIGGTVSEEQAQNLGAQQLGGPLREPLRNFADFLFGNNSADQTGEASKQQLKQNIDEAGRDKTGALR